MMIYGMHDEHPKGLMKSGWVLLTREVGHDPQNHQGEDFSEWREAGVEPIVRLNNGYGSAGTIPLPQYYGDFAVRCANFVRASTGCDKWVIGNEPNHSQERPDGVPITATDYVKCFRATRGEIKSVGLNHMVIPAPVAPWNVETGDWLAYFDVLMQETIDGIACHTYSHGSDPSLITSEATMDPPFQDRRYHFRAYRDFLERLPQDKLGLPVYITETDQDVPWLNENRGWVRAAYKEVDEWNKYNRPLIHCLCLYRWPKYDQWYIDGKSNVILDFYGAQEFEYSVNEPPVEESMKNGSFEGAFTVREASQIIVAENWEPFYRNNEPPPVQGGTSPVYRPEYKPITRNVDPVRIYDGDKAQCWFKQFGSIDAGIMQKVAVTSGDTCTFTAHLQAWCSNSNDPRVSDGEMYFKIGIDPHGGMDAYASTVVWDGDWYLVRGEYVERKVTTVAQASSITVFVRAWNKWALRHNDAYVDGCTLETGGGPTPPSGCIGEEAVRRIVDETVRRVLREELSSYTFWGKIRTE